jgi:hypothetical protein
MARPGTTDYSRWDALANEISSDEDEPRKNTSQPPMAEMVDADEDEAENERPMEPLQPSAVVRLRTGTCSHCERAGAQKRCSRCQFAWFCNGTCQAAAWPTHSLACFAKSETAAWWGFLGTEGRARDLAALQQQRLEFRRAVAVSRTERRQAAAAAAARAAALRAAQGSKQGGKGGKGGEKEETCAVCQCDFTVSGDSGEGISCPSSHFLCSECSGVFVQSILNDLEASFPPKCSMCRAEIPCETLERQLNATQMEIWNEFITMRALAESERMHKCEACGYFEIRTDRPVLWWCSMCHVGACQVCHKELPCQAEDEEAGMDPHRAELLNPHVIGCASLRDAKEAVDQALDLGSKMQCPGCGLAGRKDDACTHMACPRCHTSWCYVCGLSVERCDKEPPRPGRPADDIFLHNVDWEGNEQRCPMYLTQILEVDPDWLGEGWEGGDDVDDDTCLAHFHRHRTLKLLQEVRAGVGAETFEQVWLHFDSVRNAGFDIDDVFFQDTSSLINRDAWCDEEEGEEESEEMDLEEEEGESGGEGIDSGEADDEEEESLHSSHGPSRT